MTILKSLPGNAPSEAIVEAAWHFAHAALWKDIHFEKTEILEAQRIIRKHLCGPSLKQHFIIFCERILLAAQEGQAGQHPSIWLHSSYAHGYKASAGYHQFITEKRQSIPRYQSGIHALANSYWKFCNQPLPRLWFNLHKKLVMLREHNLIQILANIFFQINLKP